MSDYIKREDAIDYVEGFVRMNKYYHPYSKRSTIPIDEAIQRINETPSADVQEVRHGKWLPSTCEYSNYNYDCSVCGCNEYRQIGRNGRYRGFDFCPNCGARMDGEA